MAFPLLVPWEPEGCKHWFIHTSVSPPEVADTFNLSDDTEEHLKGIQYVLQYCGLGKANLAVHN